MISVCGIDCKSCPNLSTDCEGCSAMQGKVFWTVQFGLNRCPIYQCVIDKKMSDCGECNKLPCEIWQSMKDPSLTDEEHQISIKERVNRLQSNR